MHTLLLSLFSEPGILDHIHLDRPESESESHHVEVLFDASADLLAHVQDISGGQGHILARTLLEEEEGRH